MFPGFELFTDQVVSERPVKVNVRTIQFEGFSFLLHKPDQQILDRVFDSLPVGGDGMTKFEEGVVVIVIKTLNGGFISKCDVTKDRNQYIGIVRAASHRYSEVLIIKMVIFHRVICPD